MICPCCGYKFRFADPCQSYLWIRCTNCKAVSMIPTVILDEFAENRKWKEYEATRASGRPGAASPPSEGEEDGLGT